MNESRLTGGNLNMNIKVFLRKGGKHGRFSFDYGQQGSMYEFAGGRKVWKKA